MSNCRKRVKKHGDGDGDGGGGIHILSNYVAIHTGLPHHVSKSQQQCMHLSQ